MRISITNHNGENTHVIKLEDLKTKSENELFSFLLDPYYSAMGKNTYVKVAYLQDNLNESLPKISNYTIGLNPAIRRTAEGNYFEPFLSKGTYNTIVEYIYQDFGLSRK